MSAPKDPNQPCCENCIWFSHVNGIHRHDMGECVYPESKLPDAYKLDLPPLMAGTQGISCSTWEEKQKD